MKRIYRQLLSVAGLFVVFLGMGLIVNSAAGFKWGTEDAVSAIAVAFMFFGLFAPIVWIETR